VGHFCPADPDPATQINADPYPDTDPKPYCLPVVFGGKNDEGDNGDVTSAGFQVVVEASQRLNEDVASFVPKLVP
jgi:hypothetical protein